MIPWMITNIEFMATFASTLAIWARMSYIVSFVLPQGHQPAIHLVTGLMALFHVELIGKFKPIPRVLRYIYSGISEQWTLWDQYKFKWLSPCIKVVLFKRFQSHYIDRGDKIWGFSSVHCGEVFNTVSLSRSVLFERFHCNQMQVL